MTSLKDLYLKHCATPSSQEIDFLQSLEGSIAEDLWKSAGGYWDDEQLARMRERAMEMLAQKQPGQQIDEAWITVVRSFHQDKFGQVPLAKKPVKALTQEQKNSRELFFYLWVLLQATLVTKTIVFYFGIKSAKEGTVEGKLWVILAILFSIGSLTFFAYRNYRKK